VLFLRQKLLHFSSGLLHPVELDDFGAIESEVDASFERGITVS
jgi:hypothetical protein